MGFFSGMMGISVIGALLQYVMYVAVIAFFIRGTKALNIYISNNEKKL